VEFHLAETMQRREASMIRDEAAECTEQESSSRTFLAGVILFLALRALVRQWGQMPPELLRPEVLSGLVGMGAALAALALWWRESAWRQSPVTEVVEAPTASVEVDEDDGPSPEEEAEIVEQLVQSFEDQLGRKIGSRLAELAPLGRDSPLSLSLRWNRRSWVANTIWEEVEPALRRRVDKAGLSMEAQSLLESRVQGTASALLVRPDRGIHWN
jgi:hypothetical protein